MKHSQFAKVGSVRGKIIVTNTELIIHSSMVISLEPIVHERSVTEVPL